MLPLCTAVNARCRLLLLRTAPPRFPTWPALRFQLLGTACLRLAMIHAACDVEHLEVAHFVHMAANAFTADELEAQTVVSSGAGHVACFPWYGS